MVSVECVTSVEHVMSVEHVISVECVTSVERVTYVDCVPSVDSVICACVWHVCYVIHRFVWPLLKAAGDNRECSDAFNNLKSALEKSNNV